MIEDLFFAVRSDVAQGRQGSGHLADLTRKLLLELVRAGDELNRKGVTDRTRIFAGVSAPVATPVAAGDQRSQLVALRRGFERVRDIADAGEPEDAASAMVSVYRGDFEPLEQFISARNPQEVAPLEVAFNAIRGDIGGGLKGIDLAARLDGFQTRVEAVLDRSEAQSAGAFGPAFASSLVLIVREGTEVILLLAMLVTLVAKTGQAGAMRAIRWGVGLAVVASLGTAWALNRLVASAQGQARELVEGLVMLAAAGVLFYVSYWLISQSESKRWLDFLKRQAKRGTELGGLGTLALTAFLAVYREGAETALMSQAMIGAQGQTRLGLLGLSAGCGAGLVLLAGIALLVRATSVRLPLRFFFKASGVVLFAMAVVFAGNGIFELQASGILKITSLGGLSWLGEGIPLLGLYPNVQTLSVQGLLVAGAILALVFMLTGDGATAPSAAPKSAPLSPPPAGVGV
jgi:high-affinity iron transporter